MMAGLLTCGSWLARSFPTRSGSVEPFARAIRLQLRGQSRIWRLSGTAPRSLFIPGGASPFGNHPEIGSKCRGASTSGKTRSRYPPRPRRASAGRDARRALQTTGKTDRADCAAVQLRKAGRPLLCAGRANRGRAGRQRLDPAGTEGLHNESDRATGIRHSLGHHRRPCADGAFAAATPTHERIFSLSPERRKATDKAGIMRSPTTDAPSLEDASRPCRAPRAGVRTNQRATRLAGATSGPSRCGGRLARPRPLRPERTDGRSAAVNVPRQQEEYGSVPR
ncbi:hypothetical protein SAMN05878426_105190 [Phaeovulum vinaykumarii]|uniref:Uncharacterized protein n=1 Tax=Phaeovulum vinaykumarii TaxID=407234 RepID=A0A1N7M0E0_9RHOB|nr:hypothetical protein SAMN05421795_10512 [Phaeovulum vinaykumarii]SOC09703.1 hypothetical protein SAMN05878426_105190 [Phaeovulum vinaykumarii]